MIKIEHIETCGWKAAIRGMRNPMMSHDKSDSFVAFNKTFIVGTKDLILCKKLIKAGPSHRKFLRQIHIQCDITACLKFWDEWSTYQFVVSNSTSQMHLLGKRLLTEEDFSSIDKKVLKIINKKIKKYQKTKSKEDWRDMIDSIPQSFLYTRTVDFNYEVFLTMYFNRKNHKLKEWQDFCNILRNELPYMDEFINILEK